jgi:hypothetical protein
MLRVALLRQKIVHRNLCLENILLDAKGQSLSLCLRITAGIKCKSTNARRCAQRPSRATLPVTVRRAVNSGTLSSHSRPTRGPEQSHPSLNALSTRLGSVHKPIESARLVSPCTLPQLRQLCCRRQCVPV